MRAIAWLSRFVPPIVVAAAVTAGISLAPAPFSPSVAAGTGARGCPAPNSFSSSVAAASRLAPLDAALHVRSTRGPRDEVLGKVVTATTANGLKTLTLSAESFASAPVSNVVIYGERTSSGGSTVGALDLQTGCVFNLYASADAVRSAVIDASLGRLFVHSVGAVNRADRGVTGVDLATGVHVLAVPPLASADAFGPTFATLLRWSIDGDSLAVQSCGVALCRTRVLRLDANAIETYADAPQGPIIGLARSKLVTFAACPGLPCPLVAVDRSTADRSRIDVDAVAATLTRDERGLLVKATTPAGAKEIRP